MPESKAPEQILYTETHGYRVSTILIFRTGGAIEYETMVFPGKSWREVDARHDDSHREARKSHRELVAKYSG